MTLNVSASGNHWLLTDVLRKVWGFQGIVLSDAFAVGNQSTHGFASNPEEDPQISLGKDELQFWSPQEKRWVVEPSQFDVWAGEDSTAALHADFSVTQ